MLAVVVLSAAAPAPKPAAPPPAAPFVAAMAAAAPKDALRRILLKPFAAITGAALPDPGWDGANLDLLTPKAPALAPDLALLTGAQVFAGCKAQSLARLDWARLNRDRFLQPMTSDCGAGAYVAANGLAWDRDKLNFTPSWADFWDIARHPGRRALQRAVRGNLEFALLADGVAPGDIYRTLRTPDGLDRAFRKLDQIKPYLVWWDKPEQPAQMLSAGKVLLTSSPTATMLLAGAAAHRHFGVQWSGSLMQTYFWAMPQHAPQPANSMLALLIATDPARLAELATATGLGPPTRDALALLPKAASEATPSANLGAGIVVDEGFWADNEAKLEPRFQAWLAK
jgi:putative spermidine/putrescine transport system substrate-binding protein